MKNTTPDSFIAELVSLACEYVEPDQHGRSADQFSAFILAWANYHSPSA